jgi:hypothetical protein
MIDCLIKVLCGQLVYIRTFYALINGEGANLAATASSLLSHNTHCVNFFQPPPFSHNLVPPPFSPAGRALLLVPGYQISFGRVYCLDDNAEHTGYVLLRSQLLHDGYSHSSSPTPTMARRHVSTCYTRCTTSFAAKGTVSFFFDFEKEHLMLWSRSARWTFPMDRPPWPIVVWTIILYIFKCLILIHFTVSKSYF